MKNSFFTFSFYVSVSVSLSLFEREKRKAFLFLKPHISIIYYSISFTIEILWIPQALISSVFQLSFSFLIRVWICLSFLFSLTLATQTFILICCSLICFVISSLLILASQKISLILTLVFSLGTCVRTVHLL